METIARLEQWFVEQCNGDWEHQYGLSIGSLDNPGWRLTIDLVGTALETRQFTIIERLEAESDWMRCWTENKRFNAACGPRMLQNAMKVFLDWAEGLEPNMNLAT